MFNWLSSLFSAPGHTEPPPDRLRDHAPHVQAVAVHNHSLFNDALDIASHSEIYQQSPWVYVAISRIAEAAALVPLHVYRLEGEQRVAVEQHPLERLLNAPNPHLSRFELFEQTLAMLELTGNAYWFLAGDAAGRPAQIWPLRPDRMTIVPDPVRYVRGYLYEVDGQRVPLEAVEVVHFKRWHPANDYYGLSALTAARLAIDSDRAMARWNLHGFGQEKGVPAGIVSIKDPISDADFERIKREWRSSYGSGQRRTAFLRGSSVAWQHIGLSHTDLDYLKGRQAHRDEILSIFGVPIGLVSENATEANAKVAERQFIERTLWPKLVRLAQKISQELLPFYPGAHVAEFADIRPTDTQARLAEIQTAQAVLSINEIRSRYYQLAPVAWGDLPVALAQPLPNLSDPLPPGDLQPEEISASAEPAEATKAAADELAQWERYVLKRLDRPRRRAFEPMALPAPLAEQVRADLQSAGSDRDAVRAIFREARSQLCSDTTPE